MLKKLLSVISVFGIAFLSLTPAYADSTHASAKVVADSAGYTILQFGIVTTPDDLLPDTNKMFTLTSPNCGGQTGSGLPAINCGSYAPMLRFCAQKDGFGGAISGTLNASGNCFYSLVTLNYVGGYNLNQYYASQFNTSMASGYFDNNFNLQGDKYYSVSFNNELIAPDCRVFSTSNSCTYWVEYAALNGYTPYAATGVNIPAINKESNGSAYWTPGADNPVNPGGGTNFFTNCNSVPSCFGYFSGRIINDSSIFGQAITIYKDFFELKSSNGTLWRDVNPLTTNCDYSQIPMDVTNNQLPTLMNPPYNTMGGAHSATAVCCVGPIFQVPGLKVINSQQLTNPVDIQRENNFLASDEFRRPHYFAPFNACGGKMRDISVNYVIPITSALIYISFSFFLARLIFSIFSLDSTDPRDTNQVQGFARDRVAGFVNKRRARRKLQ